MSSNMRGVVLVASPGEADFFAGALSLQLRRLSWHPMVLSDMARLIEVAQSRRPRVLVIDSAFQAAQELTAALKCDIATWQVPILQILPSGDAGVWFDRLRVLADAYVQQPFEFSEVLNDIEHAAQPHDEATTLRHAVAFRLPSEEHAMEQANELLLRVFSQSGLAEMEQVRLGTALREAMLNAAQHGNQYRVGTRIDVSYARGQDALVLTIRDMGEGFAWKEYLEQDRDPVAVRREREEGGRRGGLGIMLMHKCVDRIEYNRAGNALRLIKYCREVSEHSAHASAAKEES